MFRAERITETGQEDTNMGLFDFFRGSDINQGMKEYYATPGAVLWDVRTPQEYREGHIPGSENVPLQSLGKRSGNSAEKQAPLFVYCYSGSRSRQAVGILKYMGYTNVKNLGGIAAYSGKVER